MVNYYITEAGFNFLNEVRGRRVTPSIPPEVYHGGGRKRGDQSHHLISRSKIKLPYSLQRSERSLGADKYDTYPWARDKDRPIVPDRDPSRVVAGIRKKLGIPTKATKMAALVNQDRAKKAKERDRFEMSMGSSNKGAGQEPEI
jgi:hypothetical protein